MERLTGHKFAHTISLGSHCYASTVFQRLGLRRYSGPFDWMFTTVPMVQACIDSDFEQFLDQKYYRLVPRDDGHIEHKHTFYDTYWETNFTHYDPTSNNGYAYLCRCADRLRQVFASSEPKLLMFIAQIHACERDTYAQYFSDLTAAITNRTDNATVIGLTVTPGEDVGMVEAGTIGASGLFHYTATSLLTGITFQEPADDAVIDQFVTNLMAGQPVGPRGKPKPDEGASHDLYRTAR